MVRRVLLRATGPGLGHIRRTIAVAEAVKVFGGCPVIIFDERRYVPGITTYSREFRATARLRAHSSWIDGPGEWDLSFLPRPFLVDNRIGRDQAHRVVYPSLHYEPDEWDLAHPEKVISDLIPIPRDVCAMRRENPDIDLMISFGGADPNGLAERVQKLFPEAVISNDFSRAKKAITAVGTTLYELAYLGVPTMILANWESDRQALDYYRKHGPHTPLGIHSELSDSKLKSLIESDVTKTYPRDPKLEAGDRLLALELLS